MGDDDGAADVLDDRELGIRWKDSVIFLFERFSLTRPLAMMVNTKKVVQSSINDYAERVPRASV